MSFEAVYVYDGEGQFLGSTIYKRGAQKLHTANLWRETPEDVEDFNAQLGRLQDQANVLAFWPSACDSEVLALVDNPDWEPVGVESSEVIDESQSILVWQEVPTDENPMGRLDQEQSHVVYKTVETPILTEVHARAKKAQETVARQRAARRLV